MRTVWKFSLEAQDEQSITAPGAADGLFEVVHVGHLGTDLCLWALVETDAPPSTRKIYVRRTGHEVPSGARHLGSTVILPFVWHVFTDQR